MSARRASTIHLDGAQPFAAWKTLNSSQVLSSRSVAALARSQQHFSSPPPSTHGPRPEWIPLQYAQGSPHPPPPPQRHEWNPIAPSDREFAVGRVPPQLPHPVQRPSEDHRLGSALPDCQSTPPDSPLAHTMARFHLLVRAPEVSMAPPSSILRFRSTASIGVDRLSNTALKSFLA